MSFRESCWTCRCVILAFFRREVGRGGEREEGIRRLLNRCMYLGGCVSDAMWGIIIVK